MPLNFTLDPTESEPLFLQIATRVRSAILSGHVHPGARLPSARALAAQLAVARGTVDAAYALLAGEGAIVTRGAAGTVVSGDSGARLDATEHTPFMFDAEAGTDVTEPRPFQMGLPALDAFPRKLWSNLTVQAARSVHPEDLATIDPAGLPALRQAVAAYLGVARGIRCSPAQVLITAGYQGALSLVRTVLLRHGDAVWMEDPGYCMTRQALEAAGSRVVPVRVDHEGLRVASGVTNAPRARLAVVTPTHQCPLGVAMSLPRRRELLAWAGDAGSWILEDDYDSEFRYVGRPLPALKSLDRDHRVIYAGTFSKVLFPALRLGYLVVPPELLPAFVRAIRLLTSGQPTLEQAVVAAFMQKGHFARHIRRMRILYAERRRALAAALQAGFGGHIALEMQAGGMHLLARIAGDADDTTLAKRASAAGLAPSALSSLTVAHDHGQALLLSFTNIAAEAAPALVARLHAALGPLAAAPSHASRADAAPDSPSSDDASNGSAAPGRDTDVAPDLASLDDASSGDVASAGPPPIRALNVSATGGSGSSSNAANGSAAPGRAAKGDVSSTGVAPGREPPSGASSVNASRDSASAGRRSPSERPSGDAAPAGAVPGRAHAHDTSAGSLLDLDMSPQRRACSPGTLPAIPDLIDNPR